MREEAVEVAGRDAGDQPEEGEGARGRRARPPYPAAGGGAVDRLAAESQNELPELPLT